MAGAQALVPYEEISRPWAGWWELGGVEPRSPLTPQVAEALVRQSKPMLLQSCCQRNF